MSVCIETLDLLPNELLFKITINLRPVSYMRFAIAHRAVNEMMKDEVLRERYLSVFRSKNADNSVICSCGLTGITEHYFECPECEFNYCSECAIECDLCDYSATTEDKCPGCNYLIKPNDWCVNCFMFGFHNDCLSYCYLCSNFIYNDASICYHEDIFIEKNNSKIVDILYYYMKDVPDYLVEELDLYFSDLRKKLGIIGDALSELSASDRITAMEYLDYMCEK